MGEDGILMEGELVELLEGYIVEKPMRSPPHQMSLRRLTARLPRTLPAGWFLVIQGAISLGESEPESGGTIIRGDEMSCDGRLPTVADIVLVIEVSDSSLAFDRRDKGRIYARAGIPVYWIVNVVDQQFEVYTDPQPGDSPPAYAAQAIYRPGQDVPVLLDGNVASAIPVSDLLP